MRDSDLGISRRLMGLFVGIALAMLPLSAPAETVHGVDTDYPSVQRKLERFVDRVARYACRGLGGFRLRQCFADLDGRMLEYRGVAIYDRLVLFVYGVFEVGGFGAPDRQVEEVGLIARISEGRAVRFVLEREAPNEGKGSRPPGEPVLRAFLHAMHGDRVAEESVELTIPGRGWRNYTNPRSGRPGGASRQPRLHSHEIRLGILKLDQAARMVFRR